MDKYTKFILTMIAIAMIEYFLKVRRLLHQHTLLKNMNMVGKILFLDLIMEKLEICNILLKKLFVLDVGQGQVEQEQVVQYFVSSFFDSCN